MESDAPDPDAADAGAPGPPHPQPVLSSGGSGSRDARRGLPRPPQGLTSSCAHDHTTSHPAARRRLNPPSAPPPQGRNFNSSQPTATHAAALPPPPNAPLPPPPPALSAAAATAAAVAHDAHRRQLFSETYDRIRPDLQLLYQLDLPQMLAEPHNPNLVVRQLMHAMVHTGMGMMLGEQPPLYAEWMLSPAVFPALWAISNHCPALQSSLVAVPGYADYIMEQVANGGLPLANVVGVGGQQGAGMAVGWARWGGVEGSGENSSVSSPVGDGSEDDDADADQDEDD